MKYHSMGILFSKNLNFKTVNTIFVHTPKGQPKKVETKLNATVGELMKEHFKDISRSSNNEEDFEVLLLDKETELRKDQSLESQGVTDKSTVLITQCKRTQVLVVYNGVQFVDSYPSSVKFKNVFNKAIHHFGISASEKDEFELYLTQDANSIINQSYPVGAFVSYPDCRLQVYLIKPSSFQGHEH